MKITSALSPAILRVGGSTANFLTYEPSSETSHHPKTRYSPALTNQMKKNAHNENHPKFRESQNKSNDHLVRNLIPSEDEYYHKGNGKNHYRVIANHIDSWYFDENQLNERNRDQCLPQDVDIDYKNFTMTGDDWRFLVNLTSVLKWDLLFDLNQFWRDAEGNWDPTNAELLFRDPVSSKIRIIWQLGNEPNNYHHKFNVTISPEQEAEDYRILANLLRKKNDTGNSIQIVGPEVTRPKVTSAEDIITDDSVYYLETFLRNAKNETDVISWHQYYMDGRTATLEKFLSPDIMNVFPRQVSKIIAIRNELANLKPVWLTETASAWGGGAPDLSNRFVDVFSWLDKLGAAAFGGISHVFRQTLFGGCYALLDNNLEPLPDFWVSLLHKRLVGNKVLLPRARLVPRTIRIYAHCLNQKHHMYQKGAVVVFGMNLADKYERIKLIGEGLNCSTKYLYQLSAPEGNLQSKDIELNGNILNIFPDGSLPALSAVEDEEKELFIPPYTVNFWVFPDANAEAC